MVDATFFDEGTILNCSDTMMTMEDKLIQRYFNSALNESKKNFKTVTAICNIQDEHRKPILFRIWSIPLKFITYQYDNGSEFISIVCLQRFGGRLFVLNGLGVLGLFSKLI